MSIEQNTEIFFGIGAQKAGTTWLHNILKKHPNVWMPPIKELLFFYEVELDCQISKRLFGTRWNHRKWRRILLYAIGNIGIFNKPKEMFWLLQFLFLPRTKQGIAKFKTHLLKKRNGMNALGEISPMYSIIDLETVKEVHSNFPNAKIIYLLRNPIDRVWSEAKMILLKKQKKGVDHYDEKEFIEYVEKEGIHSQYLEVIKRWRTYYGEDNVHIGFYDEISECPERIINDIQDFLKLQRWIDSSSLRERYLVGVKLPMPFTIRKLLCKKYLPLLQELSDYFQFLGGRNYCQRWLNNAHKVLKIEGGI